MKVFKILMILALVAAMPAVAADKSFEPASAGASYIAPSPDAPLWERPRAILYDNGGFMNSPGTGVGGANESILQTNLGLNTLGTGHQFALGYRIADQFTIPAGETWDITSVTTFAYQTNSPTTSSMTQVSVRILDAMPPAGAVVFGDVSTNYMGSTAWSNVYRVTDTTTGTATNRPVMAQTSNVVVSLGEGTYWLDWATDGSLSSGPWAPPITITGTTTTGDALQSLDVGATYAPFTDSGTLTGQGLPFIIEGTLQGGGGGGGGGTGGAAEPVPALSNSGIVILVLAFIGIAAVLIRRRM